MLVKDLMNKNPVTLAPETSVLDAKEIMSKNNVNKVPVLDKNNELIGILTMGDMMKASPSSATSLDMYEVSYLLSKLTVEKVMVKNVKTVTPDFPIEEAARLMNDYNISCLPVIENGLLAGLVTENDLFRCFTDMFSSNISGVRASIKIEEKPGTLAAVSKAIADLGGNIECAVTSQTGNANDHRVTIKASGITIDQFTDLVKNCGGTIDDIRNM